MHLLTFLPFLSSLFCLGIALFAFLRDKHSFTHRIFSIGMIVLSLEMGLTGMSFRSVSLSDILRWQELRMIATAFLPGVWLLFSLAFARANYGEFIKKWRWVTVSAFLAPVVLTTVLKREVFIEELSYLEASAWFLRLGWSGYAMQLAFLVCAVFILMNLERTFRTSAGAIRWRIKFIILGVGGFFALRIYSSSQTLLFSSTGYSLQLFNTATVLIIGIVMLIGLMRMRLLKADLYFSQAFLHNSVVILIIGIYLLSVGFLSKILGHFDISRHLPIEALFVLLALAGLTVALLSDEVRLKIRRFVIRHFKKPQYDYREKWKEFNERTSSSVDTHHYCDTVTKWISSTFNTSSATIWLLNEQKDRLVFGGSTALSQEEGKKIWPDEECVRKWIAFMENQREQFDFSSHPETGVEGMERLKQSFLKEGRIRYAISLRIKEYFVGLLTLNERMKKEEFSVEDLELLKIIADQVAGSLLNLKLSEHFRQAKEAEAYQTMSSFILHDLKNLASTLSLTIQNLPLYFGNPEFHKDAMETIKDSADKVNHMCNQLALVNSKIDLKEKETDLNGLVALVLSTLKGAMGVRLIRDLHILPGLMLDPEQIQKVMTNLILNAHEALQSGGEIRVTTAQRDGWAILSVSDNGCGMSKEFIEGLLFRPFKTTKKNGMGIGLYQSKMIVEAHGGRIEVESEEGKGSTFKIFLPLAGK